MKQAHVCLPECRLNQNAKDSVMVPDIVTLKKNQNQISPDRFTPLMLMMLTACGGGGGGLGRPKVRISDDGTNVSSSMWENTTEVTSESHESVEKNINEFINEYGLTVQSVTGESPGKADYNGISVAPDGKSLSFKISYSDPKFSPYSVNATIEFAGNDAEFFRIVSLDNLAMRIEFIDAPNYERPRDKTPIISIISC